MAKLIKSFGFKHPHKEVFNGLLLDARGLANPYYHEDLRKLKGDNPKVADFIERNSEDLEEIYKKFLDKARIYPGTVYVGCTGGHHRSVYIADRLAKDLNIPVFHINYDTK